MSLLSSLRSLFKQDIPDPDHKWRGKFFRNSDLALCIGIVPKLFCDDTYGCCRHYCYYYNIDKHRLGYDIRDIYIDDHHSFVYDSYNQQQIAIRFRELGTGEPFTLQDTSNYSLSKVNGEVVRISPPTGLLLKANLQKPYTCIGLEDPKGELYIVTDDTLIYPVSLNKESKDGTE